MALCKYSIVMMTVNRAEGYSGKSQNYVHTTIENLRKAHVFDYPGTIVNLMESGSTDLSYLDFLKNSRDKYPVNIIQSNRRLFLPENFSRSLRYGAAQAKRYVILMEDDVELVPHFMDTLNKFVGKYNKEYLWSMHAAYKEIAKEAKKGKDMFKLSAGKFYGNLCIILKVEYALELADWIDVYRIKKKARKCVDLQVGKWLRVMHKDNPYVCCMCPCKVQHIGDESCIDNNKQVKNQSFHMNPTTGYKK